MTKKDTQISLRVRRNDLDLISKLNMSHSQIWDIGIEHVYKHLPTHLKDMRDDFEKKYVYTVNTVYTVYTKRQEQLDGIAKIYLEQNRDVNNPSKQDYSWVESRIKDIDGLTVLGFVGYCKYLKEKK